MKVLPILSSYGWKRWRLKRLPQAERDRAWDAHHLWAAERGRRIVADLGGFFTKVGLRLCAVSRVDAAMVDTARSAASSRD